MLDFTQALATVKEKLSEVNATPSTETLALNQVCGRVLAEDVLADRDYPPFHRATRDGYAVRAGDLKALPASLECLGEIRAGEYFAGKVGPGQCVQIMTGAPLPSGADAVVMLEHTRHLGAQVEILRVVGTYDNVVRQGSEAATGSRVLPRGRRLGPADLGLLATVGRGKAQVYRQPQVAILPTGDEVVPIEQRPEWYQIRNSNAVTLAAQVQAAGGVPKVLGIAPDQPEALRPLVEEGLQTDLLLLSGGVSMGKYDFVAKVLADVGAEFFFHGVAVRPGKPLVFGRLRGKFFFGLPGNPVSTLVTFELFVRPALYVLAGGEFEEPVLLRARLGKPVRQKLGLTAFFPARVEIQNGDPVVNLVSYQGSGDLVGVAAANCFLVVHPHQTNLAPGDWVDVLPKLV